MIHTKLPAQNKEIEIAVLGAILLQKDAYDTVSPILNAQSFYVPAHQKVFQAAENLAKKYLPIDVLTVVEELTRMNELNNVGGAYEVVKLTNDVVSSAHIEAHARIIAEKHILRELSRIGSELITKSTNNEHDAFDVMDYAEKSIGALTTQNAGGNMTPIMNVVKNTLQKISEWRNNDSTLTGIPSGFGELDRATRGWQNGDLIIIAARPSGGKTALALNLIRNAALNTTKPTTVAVWSLEMKAMFLVLRMLAAESEIILHKIQTGRLSDEEMNQLAGKVASKLANANIFFDDSSNVNIRTLKAKARMLKKKNNLGLIVVDYLQLMQGEAKGNREQEISTISRELKNLAHELDVPVIALSQLSREGVKGVTWEVAPPPSSLRESGSLEQDADVILMLWGANESELANDAGLEGKRKIRIAKQRNGVLMTVELDFKSEIQLFKNITNHINPF